MFSKLRHLMLRIHSRYQLRLTKQGIENNVFGKIDIVNRKNLTIGDHCSFNHRSYINAQNPVRLGNDVTVSAGAKIVSTGVDYESWADGTKKHTRSSGVTIGDHVWIGANAVILENVSISGKYVVIAANAVVTHNITEDYVIVAGCPARIIKTYRA